MYYDVLNPCLQELPEETEPLESNFERFNHVIDYLDELLNENKSKMKSKLNGKNPQNDTCEKEFAFIKVCRNIRKSTKIEQLENTYKMLSNYEKLHGASPYLHRVYNQKYEILKVQIV